MNLIKIVSPDIPEDALVEMDREAQDIIDVLRPLSKASFDIAAEEEFKKKLVDKVFKPALDLARKLRCQQAAWSIRYPRTAGAAPPKSESGAMHTPVTPFDPNLMWDSDADDDEQVRVRVEMFVTPALFKSGSSDGMKYEIEKAFLKAEVVSVPAPIAN